MEIWTHIDAENGYRLDEANLQQNIADFSRLLVEQLGFDGVLLDVKPIFSANDDLIHLINRVRAAIGVESTIAVAVTADLTPDELAGHDIPAIAPGTMWSSFFKQRILVSADQVVLLMYQELSPGPAGLCQLDSLSYRDLCAAAGEQYADPGHASPPMPAPAMRINPAVESLANALGGVKEGLRRLNESQRQAVTGNRHLR